MFSLNWFSENICCPAGNKALLSSRGLGEEGLCVPEDQPAPQSQIAKTVPQNGVGPAPIIQSTTMLPVSRSQIVITQSALKNPTQPSVIAGNSLTFSTVIATTIAPIIVPPTTTVPSNNPVTFANPSPTVTPSATGTPSSGPPLSKVLPGSIIGGLIPSTLLYLLYNSCSQSQDSCSPSVPFTRKGDNGSGSALTYGGGQTNNTYNFPGSMPETRGSSWGQPDEIVPILPPACEDQLNEK
ncbi:hypothetical protein GLAREA_05232 [Glarea lozoyensis ATCC 20868]|uniref:Uncharacterized protein n=1 Tax=Glarea lozoyensis (strain ATCC 20868 / MF5171) TaxID=1116229 RepID=S3DFJ9_GLAL2|nr:uncharacterized protein GLAREA_05232 [Glarea lozoyensis ATCC 20868]EPE35894.1 hypothetical protein GLAREA_05232 [Glarea lozoyensis ATCC 20868]